MFLDPPWQSFTFRVSGNIFVSITTFLSLVSFSFGLKSSIDTDLTTLSSSYKSKSFFIGLLFYCFFVCFSVDIIFFFLRTDSFLFYIRCFLWRLWLNLFDIFFFKLTWQWWRRRIWRWQGRFWRWPEGQWDCFWLTCLSLVGIRI